MELIAFGFNFKTSSIAAREGFRLADERVPAFLVGLKALPSVSGVVYLSTCNRVEIYAAISRNSGVAGLMQYWIDFLGIKDVGSAPSYFYKSGEAFAHLIRVASGLDSLVLGEPQVLGQVKESYAKALELKVTGPLINFIFQQAFRIAKQIRTETGVAKYPVSISSVALMLVDQIFGSLKERTALVVGLGEMGAQTAELLVKREVNDLIVFNRTLSVAEAFAKKWGVKSCSLDALETVLPLADLVVTSTASSNPIISRQMIEGAMRAKKEKALVLIDLGFPRDIAPETSEVDNIYLYNVDDLKKIADQNLAVRKKESLLAEIILEKEIAFFVSEWERRTAIAKGEEGRVAQLVRVLP